LGGTYHIQGQVLAETYRLISRGMSLLLHRAHCCWCFRQLSFWNRVTRQ